MFENMITPEFKALHASAITEIVRGSSIPCSIIYGGSKFTDCPNCIFDPIGNKSSGRFQTSGGTQQFTGICPVCFGKGKLEAQTSENIDLAVIYNYKEWIKISTNTYNPDGLIQTISLINTLNTLKRAKELIVNTDLLTDYTLVQKFERFGEPQTCGFGQATIVATMWKRIEN